MRLDGKSLESRGGVESARLRRVTHVLVVVALAVRLVLLAAVPRLGSHLSVGIPHADSQGTYGELAYLDRRTDRIWFSEDEHCYDEMASNALAGRGFATERGWMVAPPGRPTSYGGFTYPAFLAAVYGLTGGAHQLPAFLLQILLGSLTVIPVVLLGRRTFGEHAGSLAGALFALAPGAAWSSVALMSEAVFVPLVATTTWLLVRAWDEGSIRAWTAAGAVLGVTCLTRSTLLYFVPVVAIGALLAGSRGGRVLGLVWMLGSFAVVVSPWVVRNYRVHHSFLLLDTKAGTALWQYNNPNTKPVLGLGAAASEPPVPIVPAETVRSSDGNEVRQASKYGRLALAYARAMPGHFAAVVVCRAVLAVSPLPLTNPTPLNVAIGVIYRAPLLLLALVGWMAIRREWRQQFVLLSLPIYWWAMQALSGPGQRYRLPVEFVYVILASGGAVIAFAWSRRRRAS